MTDNSKLQAASDSLEEELYEHRASANETMRLINALHRRMGKPEPHKLDEEGAAPSGSSAIGPDEFFDYGRPSDAVEALLKKLGRATAIDQVMEMLKRGGFKFSGKDHAAGLRTAIGKDGRFQKFDETDTVGLLDWMQVNPEKPLGQEGEGATQRHLA